MTTTTQFLWVNFDPTSKTLSRSHGNKARAINRHAQVTQSRATSFRRGKALQDSASSARRIARETYLIRCQRASREEDEIEHEATKYSSTSPADTAVDFDAAEADSLASETSPSQAVLQHPLYPRPLDAAELRLSEHLSSMTRYYASYAIFPAHNPSGPAGGGRHSPMPKSLISDCLTADVHISSLLTATAGRISMGDESHESQAIRYMSHATRLLREYFMTPNAMIDHQIIVDIHHLCLSEYYRGHFDAALVHLRILKEISRQLDLSNARDRYLLYSMYCYDIYVAVEAGSPPINPLTWEPNEVPAPHSAVCNCPSSPSFCQIRKPLRWDPLRLSNTKQKLLGITIGPFASRWPTKNAGDPWGQDDRLAAVELATRKGLKAAVRTGIISPAMRALVTDLMEHLDLSIVAFTENRSTMEWVDKRTMALMHRLLSASEEVGLNECCRLALIILLSYISLPMAWRSNPVVAFRLQQACKEALLDGCSQSGRVLDSTEELLRHQLFLWSLVVGMFGASDGREANDGPVFESFLDMAHDMSLTLRLSTYSELHATMKLFIHFDTAQRKCLTALEERVEYGGIYGMH